MPSVDDRPRTAPATPSARAERTSLVGRLVLDMQASKARLEELAAASRALAGDPGPEEPQSVAADEACDDESTVWDDVDELQHALDAMATLRDALTLSRREIAQSEERTTERVSESVASLRGELSRHVTESQTAMQAQLDALEARIAVVAERSAARRSVPVAELLDEVRTQLVALPSVPLEVAGRVRDVAARLLRRVS